MPLDKIITKITGDAKASAQSLRLKAQAKAEQYMDQAKAETEAQYQQHLSQGREQAKRQKRQRLQIAVLDVRKQILGQKQALITRVFNQALQELEQLEKTKYASIIKNMLARFPLVGDEEIIVSEADRQRLGDKFISQLNQQLSRQGKRDKCRWSSERRPIIGGFIIRRGKIEANCSFESLLKSSQEELEQKVARMLFG